MTPEQQQLAQVVINQSLIDAADKGDFKAVETKLNAKSIEQTDSRRKVMDDLIDVIGAHDAARVLDSLDRAGRGEIEALKGVSQLCKSEWHNLSGVGTDVSRPGVQSLLLTLGLLDNWPEGLADRVAAIGRWSISPLQNAGIDPATADDIKTAWTLYRLDQRLTNAAAEIRGAMTATMTAAELEELIVAKWREVA